MLVASAGLLLLAGVLVPNLPAAATSPTLVPPVPLGAAAAFTVLGTAVTSTGSTVVGGDLGVSPGTALVGFPPGVVSGTEDLGDPPAAAAAAALTAATLDAAGRTTTGTAISGDQAGVTLDPGVYAGPAAISLSGTMTLDGQGNPNSVFIFQINAALATAALSSITLTDGAQASNVFWDVVGAVSIGAGASFSGTILGTAAVTVGAAASLDGRALSAAAVTLSGNVVTMPPGPPVATIVSPLTGSIVLVGQVVPTAFTCADPTGPGIASCTDPSDSVSPGTLPTTVVGPTTYTVTATSTDDQTGTASIGYTVVDPDTVTFVSAPSSATTVTTTDAVMAHGSVGDAGIVSYASTTPSVCSVGAVSGALYFASFGACVIEAAQAPDPADGFAAGTARTPIAVTIPDALVYSSPPTPTTAVVTTVIDVVSATGTAGDAGSVSYLSSTPSICGVSPASGALALVAVGTCTIGATQAADAADGYLATTVATNITVDAQSAVAFDSAPTTAATTATHDAVLASGASTDRGAVTYGTITPAVCEVNALTGVLTFGTTGDCVIEATQAADPTDGYVSGSAEVGITVTGPDPLAFAAPPVSALTTTTNDSVVATGAGGDHGAVTYSSVSPPVCTVDVASGAVAFHAPGSCVVEATQAADDFDGFSAQSVETSIAVTAPVVVVTVTVTFDGNGSTGGSTPPESGDGPTALTTNGFVRTGSAFTGWTTAADGSGAAWANGAVYDFATDVTLYAQWSSSPPAPITATHDGRGYWLVASDGGVFSYGDASFYGSAGSLALDRPIVGMASTPDGRGYWLVASDGGIFSYGDASFYGSAGSLALDRPIVGLASTPDGRGYWLVAGDGGIFSYGDADFYGSAGSLALDRPIVGLAST